MREIAIAGWIALIFGLLSFHATGHVGTFALANGVLGAAALVAWGVASTRRLHASIGPHARREIARGLLRVGAALLCAAGIERGLAFADLRFDWTFEQRYQLAPATLAVLRDLDAPLEILFFYDPLDPRIRRTRALLDTLARHGDVTIRELELSHSANDLETYGVSSSNSLVVRVGDSSGTIERPTEGAIFEALHRLHGTRHGVIAVLRGEGEGDPHRRDDLGFSGLSEALITEGYELRDLVTASLDAVPSDVSVVLSIAPRRKLRGEALEALRSYLAAGGRLIALLEPEAQSGVEAILSEYGLHSPQSVLVDPASAGMNEKSRGLSPVAFHYERHPITAGLDRSRMTVFDGVRAFELRKPQPGDDLRAIVQSSPHAWLDDDLSVLDPAGAVPDAGDARQTYHPIAVAGRYPRGDVETRIVAVGDSAFAANRHLRSLYNLDLILNSVHWVLEREAAITLRPKLRARVQFPLPASDSLQMLYSVGLLMPELLLIAGVCVWSRRRSA